MKRFRQTLTLCALLVVAITGFSFAPAIAQTTASPTRDFQTALTGEKKIRHALNRLAFGARPGDVEAIQKIGLNRWIELQLAPERIEDGATERKVSAFSTLRMTPDKLMLAQLNDSAGLLKKVRQMEQQKKALAQGKEIKGEPITLNRNQLRRAEMVRAADIAQQTSVQAIGELQNEKIIRAIDSNRQLNEVLVDFWSNHFNIDVKKNAARVLKVVDERAVIRPHVLGNFRALLGASAHSPAMLVYLDNANSTREYEMPMRANRRTAANAQPANVQNANVQNATPATPAVPVRRGGLNENYAREIMELHTLGVDGGYTQKDVTEVARCFTGWSLNRRTGEFEFRALMHDDGEKTVLGHTIPAGGGIRDGERVLDILAAHPSTAKFIARKLCVRFVADEPPQSIVDKAAQTFTRTNGDLRAVVKTIVTSDEFFSTGAYRAKIKSPFEYAVSAVRALGGTVMALDPTQNADRLRLVADGASSVRENRNYRAQGQKSLALYIAEMGQPLFSYQAPTGYSEKSTDWVSTGALVARLNFALDLTGSKVHNAIATPTLLLKGVNQDDQAAIMERLFAHLLGADVSPGTRSTLERQAGDHAFIDRAKLAALIIGAPEFQRR